MATLRNNGLAFYGDFQGVGTGLIEISQQMLTKVNRAGMCVAKHQPHVLYGFDKSIRPCFASLTESYICVKFLLGLDFLVLLCHDKRTRNKTENKLVLPFPAHQNNILPFFVHPTGISNYSIFKPESA